MASKKKGSTSAPAVVKKGFTFMTALFYIAIALAILYVGSLLANLPTFQAPLNQGNAPALGQLIINTPWGVGLTFGEKVIGTIGMFLGYGADDGQEIDMQVFIVALAIFLIIFVALSDIISMFSTFSNPIAWTIGFAMAVIAGVSGVVNTLVVILGITAGLNAIGIAIIILSSVVSVVTLNMGLGGTVRRWRLSRQMEIESMKTESGTNRVTSAISGLKNIQKGLAEVEKI